MSAILLLAAACQGPAPSNLPTTSGTAISTEAAALPTRASEPSPTSEALLPGRLLFTRFDEATHTFRASFESGPDGSAVTQIPVPFTEGLARWSGAGTEVTVATQLQDGRIGTAILAPDGTVLRILKIPDPKLNLPCVFWTSDDSHLACEGWDDADPTRRGIYLVRASDGGDLRRLTSSPVGENDFPGDFSSAGRLVFKRGAENEGTGPLMLVEADGLDARVLASGPFEDPGRFSPDGTLVLTSSNGRLLIIDLDGNIVRAVADPGFYLFGPAWSPDGSHIVFSRTPKGAIADLWTSLPDGTDRHQVTSTPENEIGVDWGIAAN